MSAHKICIIDYGVGNIYSIKRAIRNAGFEPSLITDSVELKHAAGVILPGVGAFCEGMNKLKERGFVKPLQKLAEAGVYILGICLGMQLLYSQSEEFGVHKGLDIFPGNVVRIPMPPHDCLERKLPHIGWKPLRPKNNKGFDGTILTYVQPEDEFYFMHTYTCVPKNDNHILALTYYGINKFVAVVKHDNVYGCQFHPEKSREPGIAILRQFLDLAGGRINR